MYIYSKMHAFYGDEKMGRKVVVDLERLWGIIEPIIRENFQKHNTFGDGFYLGKADGLLDAYEIIRSKFPDYEED